MKKKEIITTSKYVDISDADIVQDFMENEFYIGDWYDDFIDDCYFWDDYEDLTEEDKERISKLIKVRVDKEIKKYKDEEKNLLKDRKSILRFLCDCGEYEDDLAPGEVGYSLSGEEILDLILENGRK